MATLAVVCGLLAALLLASALMKLSHKPAVVASYARAGVPERWLNALAMLLIAAAVSLVAGLFWAPLGIAAAGGLVLYFAAAIAFHLRARDFAPLGLFGRTFVGYAFAEGWAHYTEELMVEEGLADGSPDLQIGSSLAALVADVRFECSFGLHTRGMTLEHCQQLFKDVAYQDPGNARQQSYRGALDPGYLNYTRGKLMIRKLRADWRAENPGRPLREFHEAFLSHGGPPIPLLRELLLKHPDENLF